MYQQSYQLSNSERLLVQNSFSKKYLPKDLSAASEKESSLLFTPQNYMLVLSYCSSLQKENQSLRKELLSVKKILQDEKKKNQYINNRQALSNCFTQQRCQTERNFVQKFTFGMVKLNTPHSKAVIPSHEGPIEDPFFESLDTQMICMLKEENERLFDKVQLLLRQRQKNVLGGSVFSMKNDLKKSESNNKNGGFSQTFDKIRLSVNPQDKQDKRLEKERMTKTDLNLKVYRSEPNSFEISFQAPPSFKSLQDLPRFGSCNNIEG